MTITATEAYEAMRAHHRVLGERLAGRADAVSGAVAAGQPHGAAVAGLIAYLAGEVLPHAAAEEKTIYPAAAVHAGLAGMIGEMIAEHVTLSAAGARLAALTDGAAAAEQAQQIARLFAAHAARENDVLLPALLADKSVELAALLDQMHGEAGHAGTPAPAGESQAADPQAEVLSLLLQAASALARAGEADRACPARRVGVGGIARDPAGPGGPGDRGAARPDPPGRRRDPGRIAGQRQSGIGSPVPGFRPGSRCPRPASGAAPRDDRRRLPGAPAGLRVRARQRP